ncbi:ABC transporter permease [Staphylothermus hellenicus]|uniref:ABC3 transporter permease C-terminal domain-containing protein n=1 Tax=Staphylothermus hellenicus (strain DSM 12710 / JCM 10830 / BK20S6-10-b1 / P8) TaxID=591019 RepID=D7D8Q0_STAHD|nr:FtsX-like permease family protein [Staphylothermus hellenicus]ADI32146.1 protein of unknown function DUF214 [Staphylothermus hellenicus DSM 12710]
MSEEKTILPLSEAIYLVLHSIRLRIGRILIVIVAITASIAYMVSLDMLSSILISNINPQGAEVYMLLLDLTAFTVAAAGTMNSLLIMIAERYHEIGTMKSFGARDIHIFELLMLEAVILTIIGGLLGYIIGIGIGYMLGGSGDILFLLEKSLAVAVIIGLVSASYPSYQAARMSPVEALRVEV